MLNQAGISQGLDCAGNGNSARVSWRSWWLLATVVFAVVLVPSAAGANTNSNCPSEPGQATIVSGETYFGTNCVLKTASDLDTFTFTAAAGDTWAMVAGGTNLAFPNDICLTLNDPKGNTVTKACSNSRFGPLFAQITSKLAVAGVFTIVLTETQSAVVDYGISLERLSPIPGDATVLVLGKTISNEITPPSAQDAFTFYGTTTGTYEISATMTSGAFPQNLCFNVYQPGGTAVVGGACTNTRFGTTTVQAKFTPTTNGTYLPLVYSADNNDTLNYDLSVSCVSAPGTCGSPPPTCTLKDAPTYNATTATLTMEFTVATPVAATWSGWLVSQGKVQSLWSQALAITEPPVTKTKTQTNVVKSGQVGILSTLSTPTSGITCSSWVLVKTGKP